MITMAGGTATPLHLMLVYGVKPAAGAWFCVNDVRRAHVTHLHLSIASTPLELYSNPSLGRLTDVQNTMANSHAKVTQKPSN